MPDEVVDCHFRGADGEDAVVLDFGNDFANVAAEGFGGLVEISLWEGTVGGGGVEVVREAAEHAGHVAGWREEVAAPGFCDVGAVDEVWEARLVGLVVACCGDDEVYGVVGAVGVEEASRSEVLGWFEEDGGFGVDESF